MRWSSKLLTASTSSPVKWHLAISSDLIKIRKCLGRATIPANSSGTGNFSSQTYTSNAMSGSGTSHFRRLMNMRRIGNSTSTSRSSRSRSRLPDNSPFLCDLVLLNGPTTNIVPRQGARFVLMEHGHVLSACRFTKGMTEIQVEATILEAFGDKIPQYCKVTM